MSDATGTPGRGQNEPSTHNTGSAVGTEQLASRLSELARSLQQQNEPDDMLEEIVSAAVALIPGAQEGSVSVVLNRKHVSSHAASGDLPRAVDAIQQEIGQGPCLDAVYEHHTVQVPDMRTDQRWPLFAQRAFEAGAGSMLAFQLFVEDDNLGALNLYAHEANAFDDESEHVGMLFASHASVAYAEVQKVEQLGRAISTRDLIGQAKGIVMERFGIDANQAFNLLTRISKDTNRKLRDIAQELIDTRVLDEIPRHKRD